MLRILREHATSWMLKGLLLLVAVTFVSWGGYRLSQKDKVTYAAKVNGVEISNNEYRDSLQGVMKQYREALGAAYSDKILDELHVKEKVLDDLVTRVLILQEAARLGIKVSDDEVRESIESVPAFQVENQFDPRQYERFLRINRMSAEDFERMQRTSLLLSKTIGLIKGNGGKVSEGELFETYLLENERINLGFLKISPDAFRGQVDANEPEIKDYYEKRQEEFRTPTRVQAQYLLFRPADYESKIEVSADEVKRTYESQKDRFKTPLRVKAREILMKVDPQDTPEKIEEKRKRAEEILGKAKNSKDFSALAKQYSGSETASKGGDLGWIQRGMLEEPFENALLSLKKGETSGVVQARNGFYILKVEDRVEEKNLSFDEVKSELSQAMKKEKANREASRMADDAFYSLFRSRDLEGFAKEKGTPIKTTGFFKEGDSLPEIGKNPIFYSSAASLKAGDISSVVSIPPNFYILKLVERQESRVPPLDEVKDEAKRKLIAQKSEEKARQRAQELLAQVRSGKTIRDLAKETGLSAEETGFFTRTAGMIPKMGPSTEFVTSLASLTEKNPAPKEPLRTKEGFFVVRLQAVEAANPAKYEGMKRNLEKRLIYQKQEELFQKWLEGLKAGAEIEKNKDVL